MNFCLFYLPISGIGFSYQRTRATFHYVANNSAIFIPESTVQTNSHTLTNIECASGTTSDDPEQLLLIVPSQYQSVFDGFLVYEPGHWKLQSTGGNEFYLPSFSGGVFTCRMPDENGAVVDTSVGIYPENYNNKSKWITCYVQ